MASRSTEQSRREAHDELVRAVAQLGWPEEFGEVMAAELGSENAMRRMATYLRRAEPAPPRKPLTRCWSSSSNDGAGWSAR